MVAMVGKFPGLVALVYSKRAAETAKGCLRESSR